MNATVTYLANLVASLRECMDGLEEELRRLEAELETTRRDMLEVMAERDELNNHLHPRMEA